MIGLYLLLLLQVMPGRSVPSNLSSAIEEEELLREIAIVEELQSENALDDAITVPSGRRTDPGGAGGGRRYIKPDLEPKFSLPRQPCECSKAREQDSSRNDYIIGGYKSKHSRPWMALISTVEKPQTYKLTNPKMGGRCGGALINKRYVIIASHCVCHGHGNVKCSENGADAGKPLYDPRKHHFVFLGINNKDAHHDLTPDHVYGVVEVKQNPWFRDKYMPNDIAMLKLDRDVEFRSGIVEPICLPLKYDEKDQNIARSFQNRVYSAGWGKTKLFCLTDEHGPVKHNKCELEKIYDSHYKKTKYISKRCRQSPPPVSTYDELCIKLRNVSISDYPHHPSESLRIFDYDNTRKSQYCYSDKRGTMGWCKTSEKGRGGKKWGWCDPKVCNDNHARYRRTGFLKEVQMSLLSQRDCEYFDNFNNGVMQFSTNGIELCAGKKVSFKKENIMVYTENKFMKFKNKFTLVDNFGLRSQGYKLDYYIGGEDTCSGDSGGPLYTWIDGVPTLIGLVSRGFGRSPIKNRWMDGCGELNFPGIYTRVNRYLEWIHENSKDGNCQN